MKYLMLIGDGMGDHPLPELGNRTPLQAARTPAMDRLCRKSALLEVTTVPEGFHPGSDVANMSLLGYDPARYYTGRAPLEAASMNIALADDETAYRCNLVTLEHNDGRTTMIDFSAGHISSEESSVLIRDIEQACGDENFRFYPGISYRHLLVVRDLVPDINAAPPHDYIGKDISKPYQLYMNIPEWSSLVLKAQHLLEQHPVNRRRREKHLRPASSIWPWGCGKSPSMPHQKARFGIVGTMISAVDLLNGLGICAGLNIASVEGATGYIDTNYEGKARAALDALEHGDFVYVHLEAPDEAGHQGRLDHKIQAIEDFDSRIVAVLCDELDRLAEPYRIIVTMDHFTPLALQTHTTEPVPALLYDSANPQPDSGLSFDETLLSGIHFTKRVPGHLLINELLQKEPTP